MTGTWTEKFAWRGRLLRSKVTGGLRGIDWPALLAHLTPAALGGTGGAMPDLAAWTLGAPLAVEEGIERYATPLGTLAVPAPGADVLAAILGEVVADRAYEHDAFGVRAGDVVVDCGAHVGVFTRLALEQGASKVVAVEMDSRNLLCLQENLAAHGDRVRIAPAVLWSRPMEVHRTHASSSDSHEVRPCGDGEAVRATTLDAVLAPHGLGRVDLVKVDLEGAEPEAIEGAAETLRRHRPRLAIATYHAPDEERRVTEALVRHGLAYRTSYRWLMGDRPFVLFAEPAA
jgi:FkbM family methyltransferase